MDDVTSRLLETIRSSVIGRDRVLDGPFGPRRVTYADYTASGRSLSFIEDFLRADVMPLYANTHTETSGTGLQTTRFREDARALVHRSVGGGEDDVVLFAGSGATGAVIKLLDILNLRLPADLDARYDLQQHIPVADLPVVFIGPYEHHSNELPWRESIARVVTIALTPDGTIDLEHLRAELERYAACPLKIGSFSAASNVTGVVSDTVAIARLLHEHGALSLWDFAAAAPYVDLSMNPAPGAHKDAVFISPHKFIGGPGTPGVLVVKRHLLQNRVPSVPGGGTVAYVNDQEHRYLDDPEHREEGGTPEILGSIRAGLVFQLKDAVGATRIESREADLLRRAILRWDARPELNILGSRSARRLSIVSFSIRYLGGFLHHNFVVALLNDLFGIQARGGCSCAGPYGHRLLGIDRQRSRQFESAIRCGIEGMKPGWTRVNFNYFITDVAHEFIVSAVELVAEHGWKVLPYYRFEPRSGLWRHLDGRPDPVMRLGDLSYRTGSLAYRSRRVTEPEWALESHLDEARHVLDAAGERFAREPVGERVELEEFNELRWYPLPWEARARLRGEDVEPPLGL